MADNTIEGRIRALGFRVTPQRQAILEAASEAGEHATFEDILARVQAKSSAISQATVYRTLQLFSRHNLIHANEINGSKVYELASKQLHHHLICQRCGKDQKMDHEIIEKLVQNVDQEYSFLVLSEHLVLGGLCAQCRAEVEGGD